MATSAKELGLKTLGFQIWGALLSGFRTHLLSLHCHAHHLPCTDMCCAEELVGPWFPVSAIGCCIMSCKALKYDLGTEAVWEKLYTCLIEPRCGPPPRPPSSWRALCWRRFLRSVHVQIAVHCDKTLHPEINLDQPWHDARTFENRRVSTDLTARAGVPCLSMYVQRTVLQLVNTLFTRQNKLISMHKSSRSNTNCIGSQWVTA